VAKLLLLYHLPFNHVTRQKLQIQPNCTKQQFNHPGNHPITERQQQNLAILTSSTTTTSSKIELLHCISRKIRAYSTRKPIGWIDELVLFGDGWGTLAGSAALDVKSIALF
jgi:hypothetical protein